jgi:YgiT-type zinc finger domain-containing protein
MALKQGLCPACGRGHLVRDSEQRSMTYRGRTIIYSVPGALCDNCGRRYVGPYGAGVAGDRVRAQEAAIDARERHQIKRKKA